MNLKKMLKTCFLISLLSLMTLSCKDEEDITPTTETTEESDTSNTEVKDDVDPVLTDVVIETVEASNVGPDLAKIGLNFVSYGDNSIANKGVCYSTSSNPTLEDSKIEKGMYAQSFETYLLDLDEGTTYYIKAFAITETDTVFGEEKEFTTTVSTGDLPRVYLDAIHGVSTYFAYTGAYFTNSFNTTFIEKGLCYSTTNTMPTINDDIISEGSGRSSFDTKMTGLKTNTDYYIRAYAITSDGLVYSSLNQFSTIDLDATGIACTATDQNVLKYNLETHTYNSLHGGYDEDDNVYEISGSNYSGTGSDLSIEFVGIPETGVYTTANASIFNKTTEVVISGVWGGTFSEYHVAPTGQYVYVTKHGEDNYTVQFCRLRISSYSYDFYTDGNLYVE